MNEYPKIIKRQKRQQPKAEEATAASELPTSASPDESIEPNSPVEVPTEPERLEALSVSPSPNAPTLSQWQREFGEDRWGCDEDGWDLELYDLSPERW